MTLMEQMVTERDYACFALTTVVLDGRTRHHSQRPRSETDAARMQPGSSGL